MRSIDVIRKSLQKKAALRAQKGLITPKEPLPANLEESELEDFLPRARMIWNLLLWSIPLDFVFGNFAADLIRSSFSNISLNDLISYLCLLLVAIFTIRKQFGLSNTFLQINSIRELPKPKTSEIVAAVLLIGAALAYFVYYYSRYIRTLLNIGLGLIVAMEAISAFSGTRLRKSGKPLTPQELANRDQVIEHIFPSILARILILLSIVSLSEQTSGLPYWPGFGLGFGLILFFSFYPVQSEAPLTCIKCGQSFRAGPISDSNRFLCRKCR